jgi:hypothetical protein
MEKTYTVYETKHEEKVIGEFAINNEPVTADLNTLFLMEYGAVFQALLDGFDYNAVEQLTVGDTHTHYIRSDWTIDIQRDK